MNKAPTHEKCQGCKRIETDTETCSVYPNPSYWWRKSTWHCPMHSEWVVNKDKKKDKVRMGQQKQSKKI